MTNGIGHHGSRGWKLRWMMAGFAVLVIMVSSGIYLAPHLPPPAGPFPVGTVVWSANDQDARPFPLTRGGCPVSVQLWYPAEPGTGDGRAPYRPAGAGLLSAERWVRTGAKLNAALSQHRMRYPVLLSLPGWGGSRGENTAFIQDLASRGFIVAGIGYDDPACAGVEGSAGDQRAMAINFSSQAAFERTIGLAHQKIERVAVAASHVIDALEVLDRADPSGRFNGRLDLDSVGVVGYSLGGAIAMQLCSRDERLKAAINIDGWFFDAAADGWFKQPFMIISDDGPPPTAVDLGNPDPWHRYPAMLDDESDQRMASEFAKHGGTFVALHGVNHLDFSDAAYLSAVDLLRGRRPDGAAIRIAAEYSEAFFGRILSGERSKLFSDPPPGVKLRIWERPPLEESVK